MRTTKLLLGTLFMLGVSQIVFGQMAMAPAKTSGDALNNSLNIGKGEFLAAADAMPEDKYSYAPSNGEFKGVRTFAQEVKHVAAVNYIFGSAILGEKPPVELGGENGPDSVKSKAEILKFASDSFEYLQKALGSVTDKNELDVVDSVFGKAPRLTIASFACAHPMDHYGQMVEYLRMNGIVPPASRPQPGK